MTIKDLKEDIKALEEKQKITKLNRKTVNLTIERTLRPEQATSLARVQGWRLRIMYLAYATLRNKNLSIVDRDYKDLTASNVPLYHKLVEQYGETICNNSEQV